MAGMTAAASIADALRSQAVVGVVDTLWRNNEVMGAFPMIPFTGGGTINVKMHYAGNDSVSSYDEGDAIGGAGSQSYLTAQWPEKHYRGVMQITGHARDYTLNGSNEAVFFDQVAAESTRIMQDLVNKISVDMLGTGTTAPVGIQGIIDSTGTVAGVSRTTYTWFGAYEAAASSTTIVVGDLDSATQNSTDAPYAGRVNQIWTSHLQARKYKTAYGAGTTTSNVRVIIPAGGGPVPVNQGSTNDDMFYGSAPIMRKRDLTSTIWLGLTMEDFFIGKMRDFTVKELGPTDDSDRFLITAAYGLGCRSPRRSWKKTGYTDT
jgi:hypothetical protein